MDSQPQFLSEKSDEREPLFSNTVRGNRQTVFIVPQCLRVDKINAVLVFIPSALYRIKFEYQKNII